MKIYFEYPTYFLLFAVLIAAGLTLLLYKKDKSFDGLHKWKIVLLAFLRFTVIFIILALLLNLLFKRKSITENKPIIVLVQDNSSSILQNKDSVYYQTTYLDDLQELKNELSKEYELKFYTFGEKLTSDSLVDYSQELTDISGIFNSIASKYSGMNIGAIIIATDGIYNSGMNPIYSKHMNYPVYSIALGDTVQQKDLIIKDLLVNRIAFLGNRFPIRVFYAAEKCEEKETSITIEKDGESVYSGIISLPKDGNIASVDIELPADRIGLQQYKIKIGELENEISITNNYADFIIDVIDNRQKILLLGDSPHPDIGAIRFALKDNPNFEIDIDYASHFNKSLDEFDLVILHRLPSKNNNISNLLSIIESRKIPALYILGTNSNLDVFNSLSTGLQIITQGNSSEFARAVVNSNFLLFEPGKDIESMLGTVPPLTVFFGEYRVSEDIRVLMHQIVNGIKTDKPLVAFSDRLGVKTGFILGEGLWKWRITDFRHFSSHTNFNELISKIVQYIAVKRINDKLITDYKRIFDENESVIIHAELYNETFELVSNQTISLILRNEEGIEYSYFFNSIANSYRIDLGKLPTGRYYFEASADFDNSKHISLGEFIVREINIEAINTTANHHVLYGLANKSGGKVIFSKNMMNIPNILQNNDNIVTIATYEERDYNIHELVIIFFLLLTFAAIEWFLRKYWGSY